jgi:hypothetical protein
MIWLFAYVSKASTPSRAREFADSACADYLAKWPDPDASERLPVYRLRNGDRHFFTIDEAERDGAIANYGYELEGIAFYAFRAP